MTRPDQILDSNALARNGGLSSKALQLVRSKLRKGGFVILPSDTSFSLAIIPQSPEIPTLVNAILARPKGPISLAFRDIDHAFPKWVHLTSAAQQILETFTPGPITVVCPAADDLPPWVRSEPIAVSNATIGVRIPDSVIEREVASCTDYLITTVAIRNPSTGEPIRDLREALQIVESGLQRANKTMGWLAIDGGQFYGTHSTVVDATSTTAGAAGIKLIREGDIPFQNIQNAAGSLSLGVMADW